MPRFCKRYAQLGEQIRKGLDDFKRDVEAGAFPSDAYSPYKMPAEEEAAFNALMARDSAARDAQRQAAAERIKNADEYEQIKLY